MGWGERHELHWVSAMLCMPQSWFLCQPTWERHGRSRRAWAEVSLICLRRDWLLLALHPAATGERGDVV